MILVSCKRGQIFQKSGSLNTSCLEQHSEKNSEVAFDSQRKALWISCPLWKQYKHLFSSWLGWRMGESIWKKCMMVPDKTANLAFWRWRSWGGRAESAVSAAGQPPLWLQRCWYFPSDSFLIKNAAHAFVDTSLHSHKTLILIPSLVRLTSIGMGQLEGGGTHCWLECKMKEPERL